MVNNLLPLLIFFIFFTLSHLLFTIHYSLFTSSEVYVPCGSVWS